MNRTRWLYGVAALAVIVGTPIGWYLISPLFITRTVNEDFPAAQAAAQSNMTEARSGDVMMTATDETVIEQAADAMMTVTPEMSAKPDAAMMVTTPEAMSQQRDAAMTATTAETMIQQPTATMAATSAPESDEPKLLRSGEFHPVQHEGMGTAMIYQLPDGKRVLRLEDFEVLNGPDLYVWLSSAPDANNARTILDSQHVSLGRLKGNKGNQNYELPDDLDLSAFNSVTIWCRRFSVNFATAPLS